MYKAIEGEEGRMVKRTTHRSSSGKKLYAVRDKEAKFKDIQSYRGHTAKTLSARARRRSSATAPSGGYFSNRP
jgi:hypothetical protein